MEKRLEDLPIVRGFSGSISLGPCQAQHLYRLAPSEMKELSDQLKELSDKGFIRAYFCTIWELPVLFGPRRKGIIPVECLLKDRHEVGLSPTEGSRRRYFKDRIQNSIWTL
ncbi:hypothetical protein Tco_0619967 [Tanacetum coccineum]